MSCQGQSTCAGAVKWSTAELKGVQVLRATVHTNTGREATSAPVYVGGFPRKPHAKVNCHIASFHILRHHNDAGSCIALDVSPGTDVALQFRIVGQDWANATKGHISSKGLYDFRLRSPRRVTFEISVLVAASRHFAATRVLLGTVRVT